MVFVLCSILFGFVLGVLALVAAEALGLLWIMKRLRNKIKTDQLKISSQTHAAPAGLDPHQSLNFASKKQGVVWVLESDKIANFRLDRPSREKKRKKEVLEVSPIKMYAKIKDQSLIIREADGFHTTIQLKGCTVHAVSASSLSPRKWAKKFPIKVESKTSAIYNGNKTLYIYLETSWEKEAWCKALHLASCDQKEKIKWFAQLHEEFHSYVTSLNAVYHSFMKPSTGSSVEAIERDSKPDDSSSKVRQIWKKLANKTARVGLDNKSTWTSLLGREERKNSEKLRASQDAVSATGLTKTASTVNHLKNFMADNAAPLSSTLSQSGSQSHISASSDADPDADIDDGTLCWNLLISRLFFDVKGNVHLKRSMQARIQRTLSKIRTPSYLGEVICTNFHAGNLPPCIIGMRVLPMEMSEVWAFEVDIEYSGGALLEIETRLEVPELELHRGTEDSIPELIGEGAVSSDLLEGLEHLRKELNIAERVDDLPEQKEDGDWNTDVSKSFKNTMSSSTHGSRWKSLLNSVAKHVSQVPLSLAIRVASLRGTLRLHIKPSPSDQLWYGFTSMPAIDFKLESYVGEHKIASGHIALFLVNRLKVAIREMLVLPNCESICIPWMLAEKDDWVPRNVAPFVWVKREYGNETSNSIGRVKGSARTSNDDSEHQQQKPKSAESSQEPARKSSDSPEELPLSSSSSLTLASRKNLEELKKPLLENGKPQETRDLKELGTALLHNNIPQETSKQNVKDNSEFQSPPRGLAMEKQNHPIDQDDGRPKGMRKRDRMLKLGKKMGEKLEEKGRNIVEKMRGP